MVKVDVSCTLESFRKFTFASTCRTFAPNAYLTDPEIFPEREEGGIIYVEAVDKVTLKKIRRITFVNVQGVLGVIYNSNSGSTSIKWRQTKKAIGRATGEASVNSLKHLAESGVFTIPQVEAYVEKMAQAKDQSHEDAQD
ncbi:MAG: hypothetical protein F4Y82_04325 [Cenarchaeum sp. SB0665_bin_23]|nr:hypothetical protein [Cenarchaeum sp. SB0667_bin_13]MXY61323.1 hypothetical protein [Cenarchaeum sp. SB0665_bin_23]MXZ94171.1 hypothetical protein [Cenarchaeum sp. SB0666_bin_15]MYB46378.1 hypothetical protein [Cenarchaeum sp. SB0662_bin_33]MYC80082.1 hypothetical protein [Cenarchaeum sp. SB0661_bin_35]MYD58824.1 hypothetical protein [Cenarchaeum sp. SB0678_bin_8]MYG33012.1 hypothetical protein [Cenarchaeum sp. SB0677_bin_16]MYJ27977.1 hypothetical protein [Cenarchaeum sp. SB0672_bin_9]